MVVNKTGKEVHVQGIIPPGKPTYTDATRYIAVSKSYNCILPLYTSLKYSCGKQDWFVPGIFPSLTISYPKACIALKLKQQTRIT